MGDLYRRASRVIGVCLVALALMPAGARAASNVDTGHVKVALLSATRTIVPGKAFEVGIRETIAPGWHTYWRNPGDSGAPTTLTWHLPGGFSAGGIEWPVPERVPYGPLMNFGYQGDVLFPVEITPPATLVAGEVHLKVHARWLVCSDICIPEQGDLDITLPVSDTAQADTSTEAAFAEARQHIPQAIDAPSTWSLADDRITLSIKMPGLSASRIKSVEWFPYSDDVIDNAARQRYQVTANGLKLVLQKARKFVAGTSMAGVMVVREDSGQVMTTAFEVAPTRTVPGAHEAPGMGLAVAIGFAFLGGMILNLMPCVFPVLSIKVLALAKHREGANHVRSNGWAYAIGVILSFVAIAAVLVSLRSAGEQIGWGFQLQSPVVVVALTYLFFLIGLNLSGLFEAGTALMNVGDGLASRPGLTGSFFTGVLATLVAAPCTAPFMAGAVGYALLLNNMTALAVFAALGAGMAAPYLLLCYLPGSVRLLPKPGAWMEIFKELLAFPMYGSAIWLIWVLSQETGPEGVLVTLSGLLLISMAVWLWRRAQGRPVIVALAVLLVGVAACLPFRLSTVPASAQTGAAPDANHAGPVWESYSPARLAELRKQGPVFVDFTAAWCITCKVNDAVALDSDKVRAAFAEKHVHYLRGDWTNQDPDITAALAEYGRSGVPLYLLYVPGVERAKVLPQILTQSIVLRAIESL